MWWPKDCAWWRREHIVELGEEFGADGPAVLDWLSCEAKVQNDGGIVKAGYRTVARGSFVELVTVRHVVSRAVTIGALDDFEEDGTRFVCRISGWAKDNERGRAAVRQADARDRAKDGAEPNQADGRSVTDSDVSRPVTVRHGESPTEEKRTEEDRREDQTPKARERAESRQRVFDAWVSSTGRTDRTVLDTKRRKLIDKALDAYPEQDVLDAVRGWRHSPHHCGQNDTGTVYNDLGLLLRDPGNIERFRDLERRPPTPIRPQQQGGWTAADMIRIGKETA